VDALNANSLRNIRLSTSGDYLFEADIQLTTNNALINKALNVIARQGTNLSMKGVSFTNPVSGLVIKFNLGADHKLNDFSLSAAVQFPVKGVDVTLTLTYSQVAATSSISLPRMNNVILDRTQIATEMQKINDAIEALGQSNTYSLDLLARNEFDPGWNVTATVDKYTARMYKHTYDLDGEQFAAFNHSFEYKTHHETDGSETYKYTIGNIKDGSVHQISRKGSNTITALDGVSCESQFNYLTGTFVFDADKVDCIKKETSGNVTKYTVYLKESASLSIGDKVVGLINSNEADGVIEVNNYFDESDYLIKESVLTVTMSSTSLQTIEAETKIKYNPLTGDYADKRITLTDSLTLEVNKHLSDAQEYTAPKSTTTSLGSYGLNNAKYYIL